MTTCVPVVGTAGPGELIAEGKDQVEQGPSQYGGVTYAAVQQNHQPPIANTCKTRFGSKTSFKCIMYIYSLTFFKIHTTSVPEKCECEKKYFPFSGDARMLAAATYRLTLR